MTADIDAKLPTKPSLEGYKVDVLSLDSISESTVTHSTARAAVCHQAWKPETYAMMAGLALLSS